MDKDKIFSRKRDHVVDFKFDESVSRVFPDMIRRSIPGYETIIELCGSIAEKYAQPDSNIYDLGCSHGATTLSMSSRALHDSVTFVAVDNSSAMLDKCRVNLGTLESKGRLRLVESDVERVEIVRASIVAMNFTLQFITPVHRDPLVQQIYEGLNPGGVFILSEKISFGDSEETVLQQQLHEQFKSSNGYSELEVSQKRTALEKVMVIEQKEQHLERIKNAGFRHAAQWFQSFNFASFIAVK
jgi:tRNA (cmo5U34)-methyltransferase